MARKHQMMLSDLYGRIGQMLAEHKEMQLELKRLKEE